MTAGGLKSFMSGDFLWVLASIAVIMIIMNWRKAEWAKIGSVVFIFLLISDFATNKGQTVMSFLKWLIGLFGIKF
ncbi:hypothetical protein [Enterococcus sp. C76]|uniref:hypothetical protein n=1 Tax=Enterococcus TaxID=1350 RepID=UPI0034A038AE